MTLSDYLRAGATLARFGSRVLPGLAGTVADFASAALTGAASVADVHPEDPQHITRILDLDPLVAAARARRVAREAGR